MCVPNDASSRSHPCKTGASQDTIHSQSHNLTVIDHVKSDILQYFKLADGSPLTTHSCKNKTLLNPNYGAISIIVDSVVRPCFQRLQIDVQAEESEFQTSVPCANLIKVKTHFQVILMNWNITSSKMVRNNILEGLTLQEKYPGYASRNNFFKFV